MDREKTYVEKLSEMINVETIATPNSEYKFVKFQDVLKKNFPLVFSNFKLELFDGSILLSYIVDSKLDPILLMSHQDVVEPNSEWKHEPFNAKVENGKLYGRGTLDTKGNLFAILQSIEELLDEGYQFKRSIYIESSNNEETIQEGAHTVFKELEKRQLHFYFVIDEGGMIVDNPFSKDSNGQLAMVALGEKAILEVIVKAKCNGSHSSAPSKNSGLVRLGKFMAELDSYKGFKPYLNDVTVDMLNRVSKTQSGVIKFLFKHAGIFRPIIAKIFTTLSPATNAMVRTTVAFTVAKGAEAYNVIPNEPYIGLSIRVSHKDGVAKVFNQVKKIASKYDLECEVDIDPFESPICSPKTESFNYLTKTINKVFPDIIVAPYIANGGSDSKWANNVTDSVFRFAPFAISNEQLDTIHGVDENVDVSSLIPAVDFFKELIKEY